ncbi:MAG TPA: ankyrin repeat domain-containing protein [Candidatus Angelobacter sp.]
MSHTPPRSVSSRRDLPARASLEHLRNEAKVHLRVLRQEKPATRLSQAQLDVARSYGFSSWRGLKTYVDSLHGFGARIIQAVRQGDLPTIPRILDRYPELVNASTDLQQRERPSDTFAMRLTHLAIAENQTEVLRLLIERGADVNARNTDGRLPLHDCFELGRDHLVPVLLEAGARPDVCAAAAYGMHDRLREILQNDPCQANDLTTGESPLGWSVYGRQTESALILFQYGALADRAPYDAQAWRPASMVAGAAVARILLDHGANPNWRDMNGDTPLHRVLKSRLVLDPTEFVKVLLAAGADASIRNEEGHTAIDEALLQQSKNAETYFPVRTIGPKKLELSIEMLRSRLAQKS